MDPYLPTLLAAAALMTAVWLVSLLVRDASIVDPVWGMTFVVIAWTTWLVADGGSDPSGRSNLIVALVTIWGLRLSIYLTWRKTRMGEDERYVRIRARYGPRFPLVSLGVVFLLQAVLAWIVSLPVQAGQISGVPLGPLDIVGVGAWAVGLTFEAIGDWQMARFKSSRLNIGQVMDRGLWRYTRHPNYFGDLLVWWGLFLIAASAGSWWTVIGPLLMSVLLVRVSGVALLERTIGERRPGYAEYVARTSAIFPRPPKAR